MPFAGEASSEGEGSLELYTNVQRKYQIENVGRRKRSIPRSPVSQDELISLEVQM